VRTAHAASIDKRRLASRLRSRCDGDHKWKWSKRASSTSIVASLYRLAVVPFHLVQQSAAHNRPLAEHRVPTGDEGFPAFLR
jgi:hypothetical protein